MEKYEAWLSEVSDGRTEKEKSLLRRAAETIMGNVTADSGYPWSPYRGIMPGTPGKGHFEGIWNWDTAFHAVCVSRWDTELAEECIRAFMQYQLPNGMLPDVMFANGFFENRITKPPVLPWAVENVYRRGGSIDFVKEVYPSFVRYEKFLCENRCDGGLFFYGAEVDRTDPGYEELASWESGWDYAVRWDGVSVSDLWTIDLNCYMVMMYRSMAFFADMLGLDSDKATWTAKELALTELINEKLWDDEMQSYADVLRATGKGSGVYSPAIFMPLYVEIAPKERAERMNVLGSDDNKFHSGMPTVSYDDKCYSDGYWRGRTWLNTAYFAAKGLKNYGFDRAADDIKDTILTWCDGEKRGIFENYDSKTGAGMGYCGFSWSCTFIIEFILNF